MLALFESVSYSTVLFGGALIGLSSVLLFLFNGRIAGICGITFSLMATNLHNNVWRIVFLLGLIIGSLAYHLLTGAPIPDGPNNSLPWLIVAGLLVGYGTSMGNGCTSGHGISGISRFSKRSIVATLTFMASAIITVFVFKHVLGVAI